MMIYIQYMKHLGLLKHLKHMSGEEQGKRRVKCFLARGFLCPVFCNVEQCVSLICHRIYCDTAAKRNVWEFFGAQIKEFHFLLSCQYCMNEQNRS